MAWYINDLSLVGQYQESSAFLEDIRKLMHQREQIPLLKQELYCSRLLSTQPVTQTDNFRDSVLRDRTIVQSVLAWVTKYGPFWDDSREQNQDDYFECHGKDVTDQGLGEAARCHLAGKNPYSVSFSNGGFDYTPIDIVQGLPEEPLTTVSVQNIWDFSKLQSSALAAIPTPCNWHQMMEQARMRFDRLIFSPKCINELLMQPFSAYVVERVFELLRVLNEFMQCRKDDGTYSERNQELIDQHFSGNKAWFTDESVTNKRDFKNEMNFPDFELSGNNVFCSWHGKIKNPQYRIHFEWPSSDRQTLRIFYIGPKITKK